MIRNPDAPSLLEFVLAVIAFLLLIGAATWGVQAIQDALRGAVTP